MKIFTMFYFFKIGGINMKKISALILAAVTAASMCACGASNTQQSGAAQTEQQTQNQAQTQNQNQTQTQAQTNGTAELQIGNTAELPDCVLTYKGARIGKDYQGNPAIILKFNYKNTGSAESMFSTAASVKLFQDGVGLENAIITDGTYDAQPSLTTVQNGGALDVEAAYKLRSATSQITVTITDWLGISGRKMSGTITLQ